MNSSIHKLLTRTCTISRRLQLRLYETKTGVFGHKPKPRKKYINVTPEILEKRANNSNFYRLVTAYREHGHKKADINPITITESEDVPELNPKLHGLECKTQHDFDGIIPEGSRRGSLEDAIKYLERTYCNNMSVECMYMEHNEREWFIQQYEQTVQQEVEHDRRRRLLFEMLKCQTFEQFVGAKFVTSKRYGGEGAETLVGFFMQLLEDCSKDIVEQIVIAMPHRGKLNILTGILQLPPSVVFRKMKGYKEFNDDVVSTGDLTTHLTCSVDITPQSCTRPVHVTMLPNPSHLEAANPVSMGKTRAKQMMIEEGGYGDGFTRFGHKVINIQIHGDAALAGQGVNQETLSLSRLPHYEVGGTIHVVVNNQLGFTTPADRGRSSRYTTDLAKMISAPVLHVNGDHPEEVLRATSLAVKYQRRYRRDVFIDLNCYRQWGHNELDDPTFTNPAVYKIIRNRPTIPDTYASSLVNAGVVDRTQVEQYVNSCYQQLSKEFQAVDNYQLKQNYFQQQWTDIQQASSTHLTTWDTGFEIETLKYIGDRSVSCPAKFNVHHHLLKTHVANRQSAMRSEPTTVDWSTAEALAIGSLLYQGYNVRLSGQDVGRGTFSHRHCMLVDQTNNDIYVPLNNIVPQQKGRLEVANSSLSEEAVLGFEYGMSIEHPNNLIIWEAQFGDFVNGAQIIIDQFITNGEMKWMKCSGLVMLLPHGYDGAGPEHSSCRVERFLQLNDSDEVTSDTDNVNFNIINPTTPAQYFHALRRQLIRNYRKPLVIVAPKILLRYPKAVSDIKEMRPNTEFLNVIIDPVQAEQVDRVIFTTGKHYYNLDKERIDGHYKKTAIVRLESLSPFPTRELQQVITRYKNAKKYIWSQEEHRNMGAWQFVNTRFSNLVGVNLEYVGGGVLGTPAVGVPSVHRETQDKIIKDSFVV